MRAGVLQAVISTRAVCAGDGAGPAPEATAEAPEDPKFLAFAGSGRRLDGKAPKHADSPVAVPVNNYQGECCPFHRAAPRQRRRIRPATRGDPLWSS